MTASERHRDAVVLVTGAAQGIGRACAARIVADGGRVVLADVNGDGVQAAAADLGGPERARAAVLDVRSPTEWAAAVAVAVDGFGRLTGLVNAAGIVSADMLLADVDLDSWHAVIDVNLTGTLLGLQAAAPHLGPGGSIVNIASGAGSIAHPKRGAYSVSKAGVLMLTKVAALELGRAGVRVNAVQPGFIETAMTAPALADPERRRRVERNTPVGRTGQPEDVAAVVSFLLSDDAAFVSGELVAVDGGIAAAGRT